jgi:two-component system OmpR family response regulator
MSEAAATRILLVDDEAALREVLADYLVRQGCRHPGGQRHRGPCAARAGQFDLVLLDIMMPGEDGLSLCRHMAETARCR